MAPTAPPPLFPLRDHRPVHSPPRNPELAGCAGGARQAGSSSPSPIQSARVEARALLAASSPELPEDMVMCVLATLEIPDLVRAGAVCTSWRSAYITLRKLGKYRQHQTPCLLYTSESAGDNVACLYSLVEQRVYRLDVLEPPIRSRFLIGSSLGFLVTVDERSEMHLVNPITGEQIDLPSVTTMPHVKPICNDSGAVHRYQYSMPAADQAFSMSIHDLCELRESFHFKAFLFYDTSTGSFIVALIHEPFSQLSFARVGDDKWTRLPPHSHYQDCTYKDGLLYAVTIMGEIHAFHLSGHAATMEIIRGMDLDLDLDAVYIIQSPWGGLLLVSRSIEIEDPDDEDADPEIPLPKNTVEIKLHKVDVGTTRLVEIDCLPDHVLFLGHNHPLCLSAKEYPALKGSHAYFTDGDEYITCRKSCRRDIGVVDLGNNNKEDLVSPQLWSNWPAPVWITPNLTVMKQVSNNPCLSRRQRELSRPMVLASEHTRHSVPPAAFINQDYRSMDSPHNFPPMGCAGGAWSAGSSAGSNRFALVNSGCSLKKFYKDEYVQASPIETMVVASPELPEDVLMGVFATLEIPDLVRAGSVCTSWRSAYITLRNLGKHTQSQMPCLLYTAESAGDNVACLYSLVEKRVYKLNLPEPPIRSRFLIGSSLGLLVTVDERAEMHLVNPITGEQTALPSVITFDQVKPVHDDSGAVHNYEYSRRSGNRVFCSPEIITPARLWDYFHYKALVFSDTSTGSYIVVLIHGPRHQISFARVGDVKWTSLPPHVGYKDCTYKDGLLYAVTIMAEIHAYDLSGPAVTMNIIKGMEEDLDIEGIYILQAPWGGLLLVWRSRHYDDHAIDADPETLVMNTTAIKIHSVDAASGRLVDINFLDDHALFLGHNEPQCLSTKEYPALKGNHAYLTDDYEYIAGRKNNRRDIGVLDLDSKEDLVSPQLWSNWPAPVWILPNLRMMKLALHK